MSEVEFDQIIDAVRTEIALPPVEGSLAALRVADGPKGSATGDEMEKSVFEIVKAPLGWSVFADNVKIGGVYDSRGAALEAAALAASYTVSNGGGVQIIVPGADQERPRWGMPFDMLTAVLRSTSAR